MWVRIKAWIAARAVPGWQSSWRWLSMQLAVVAGLAVSLVIAFPEFALNTLTMIPPDMRAGISPLVGIGLSIAVAAVRLWRQSHPRKPQ